MSGKKLLLLGAAGLAGAAVLSVWAISAGNPPVLRTTALLTGVAQRPLTQLSTIDVLPLSGATLVNLAMGRDIGITNGRIAAIGALAGAMYLDPADCKASEPVSVLAIHGTADTNVHYEGGGIGVGKYPSAEQSVKDWAVIDGCGPAPVAGAPLDLEKNLAGDETTVSTYTACKAGASVELRTIVGGAHIPALSPTFTSSAADWLLAQHKP